jgi:hypothetical protein
MHLTGTNGVYDCESIVQHSLGIVAQVLLHHRCGRYIVDHCITRNKE